MTAKRTKHIPLSLTASQWQTIGDAARSQGETVTQFVRNVAIESAEAYADSVALHKERDAELRMRIARKLIVHDFGRKAGGAA